MKRNTIAELIKNMIMTVHADEGASAEPTTQPNGTASATGTQANPAPPAATPLINFEEMIAQARKEEKDKLYPKITKLQNDIAALQASNNTLLLEKATLQRDLEVARDGNPTESEKVKVLELKVTDLEKKLKEAEAVNLDEEELRAKIEQEFEVKNYLAQQIANNPFTILPTLHSEITGTTKEEVDAAIKAAKEKTKSTCEAMGIGTIDPETGECFYKDPAEAKGTKKKKDTQQGNENKQSTKPTRMSNAPSGGSTIGEKTPEDIRTMTREEYAKWREESGIAGRTKRGGLSNR